MNFPASVAALGEVVQLGFVVEEWEPSLSHWLRLGAGPFQVSEQVLCDTLLYRGKPATIDYALALGYWAGLQIELIRPNDRAPSIYREWLDQGREGLHHVAVVTPDIASARTSCEAAGGTAVQELTVPGGAAIYYDFGAEGPLYEVMRLPQAVADRYEEMRQEARVWDGSDPIRIRATAR